MQVKELFNILQLNDNENINISNDSKDNKQSIYNKCKTFNNYASLINISEKELNNKLLNIKSFTQAQIIKTINSLNLNNEEATKCFFTI